MRACAKIQARREAMTLIETLLAATIGSAIIGAMVFGSVSFQQLSNGTEEYYKATSDQMRVLDFIARDMRSAPGGSVSNNGQTLILKLPDYLDYSQDPPIPRIPTISKSGTVTYGVSSSQPTVVYAVTGIDPKQTITRTLTPSSGAATTTTLTSAAASYEFLCFDPANPGSTAPFSFGGVGEPSSIATQITFLPKFRRINNSSARAGTVATKTILLRNHQ